MMPARLILTWAAGRKIQRVGVERLRKQGEKERGRRRKREFTPLFASEQEKKKGSGHSCQKKRGKKEEIAMKSNLIILGGGGGKVKGARVLRQKRTEGRGKK